MIALYNNLKKTIPIERVIAVLKRGMLYFGASFIGMVLSIYAFPVFSKYLSEEDFAVFNYFTNLSVFFTFIFGLQFYVYYSAQFFRCDNEERKKLTSTIVLSLLIWNPIIIGIVYAGLLLYFRHMQLTIPYLPYCLLAIVTISLSIYKGIYLIDLRMRQRAWTFFSVSAFYKIGTVALSVMLMMLMYNHLVARFYGVLFIEAAVGAFSIYALLKNTGFKIDRKILSDAVKYIIPLLGASLIYYPVIGFDQIVLERLGNTKELGYYSLGLTFAGYLHIFNYSIYQAIEPDIIKATVQANYKRLSRLIASMLCFTALTTLCFVLVSRYLIDYLTNGKFLLATGYANILAVSFIFIVSFSIGNDILNALKKNKATFYSTLLGGIFSIVIYIIAANWGGFYPVAYSRIAVFIFLTLLTFFFAYREMKTKKEHS